MKTKISKIALLSLVCVLAIGAQVMAAPNSTLNQTINTGVLAIDMVDGSGASVASPSVAFGATTFSFDPQDTTGTLGTASEKIRVSNGTNTSTWTASIAASAATDTWSDGGTYSYDFNDGSGYTDGADTDSVGGQLTVDPSSGSIVAPDTRCNTTGLTAGATTAFDEGSVDSIDLMSADGTARNFCRWDMTGVGLSQGIPGGQEASSYSLSLVLSVV